jgi:lysophospholipase L1-like esterase
MPKIKQKNNLFMNLVVFCVMLIFCLTVFEIVYRHSGFHQYTYFSPMYSYDGTHDFVKHIPNFTGILQNQEVDIVININSLGERDLERTLNKTKPRIALVGDSMIFGHVDFNDTIAQQLQNNLSDYEILNFGVSGHDPRDYFTHISQNVVSFDPDLVITAIYLGNDIKDLEKNRETIIYNGYIVGQNSVDSIYKKLKFKLVLFLKRYIKSHGFFYDLFIDSDSVEFKIASTYVKRYSDYPETLDSLNKINNKIKQIDQLLKSEDINHIILLIPHKVQLIDEKEFIENYFSLVSKDEELSSVNVNLTAPQSLLKEFMDREGIAYIDLFYNLTDYERYYYQIDSHLNQEGNALVADLIAEQINKNNTSSLSNYKIIKSKN